MQDLINLIPLRPKLLFILFVVVLSADAQITVWGFSGKVKMNHHLVKVNDTIKPDDKLHIKHHSYVAILQNSEHKLIELKRHGYYSYSELLNLLKESEELPYLSDYFLSNNFYRPGSVFRCRCMPINYGYILYPVNSDNHLFIDGAHADIYLKFNREHLKNNDPVKIIMTNLFGDIEWQQTISPLNLTNDSIYHFRAKIKDSSERIYVAKVVNMKSEDWSNSQAYTIKKTESKIDLSAVIKSSTARLVYYSLVALEDEDFITAIKLFLAIGDIQHIKGLQKYKEKFMAICFDDMYDWTEDK